MYELTTEGMFKQVQLIEKELGRKLNHDEDLYFVRSDVVCVNLEQVFVLGDHVELTPFFELSEDIQQDILAYYEKL